MSDDTIVAAVQADLAARSARGVAKYGVTLDRTDLSRADWIRHAYEEALDLALYLRRALRDAEATPAPCRCGYRIHAIECDCRQPSGLEYRGG